MASRKEDSQQVCAECLKGLSRSSTKQCSDRNTGCRDLQLREGSG